MSEDELYPIAVLIDELKNEDVQVCFAFQPTPIHSEARRVGSTEAVATRFDVSTIFVI